MRAYYNEHDPFAAAWLRELMADGLIAPGDVDERSIEDVTPGDLLGYRQCHFFAGIGVWSIALRLAGWPDDRAIWTGSCPCQPFSAAGKGGGFADERHLWPAFGWLIGECRPAIVVGEQVGSDDGLAWLDVVLADLDQAGYTSGALDTCAAGFGAPHTRQRLYWMGYLRSEGLPKRISERGIQRETMGAHAGQAVVGGSDVGWMADVEHSERRPQHVNGPDGRDGQDSGRAEAHGVAGTCGEILGMADANATGPSGQRSDVRQDSDAQSRRHANGRSEDGGPGPTNGLWRDADWLGCRDGKWRPVEPGTFPLVAARTLRNRMGTLRGAGNALNVAQAQGFIEAMIGVLP